MLFFFSVTIRYHFIFVMFFFFDDCWDKFFQTLFLIDACFSLLLLLQTFHTSFVSLAKCPCFFLRSWKSFNIYESRWVAELWTNSNFSCLARKVFYVVLLYVTFRKLVFLVWKKLREYVECANISSLPIVDPTKYRLHFFTNISAITDKIIEAFTSCIVSRIRMHHG